MSQKEKSMTEPFLFKSRHGLNTPSKASVYIFEKLNHIASGSHLSIVVPEDFVALKVISLATSGERPE